MSVTAIIIIIVGLSILISRAPLMVAPEAVRRTYLKLFDTDGKMRVMGVIFAAVAAVIIWAVWGISDTPSQIVRYVAGFVLVLAVLAMIPFPAFSRRLATRVWTAFPTNILRMMGAFAVAVGALMVWYGLNF